MPATDASRSFFRNCSVLFLECSSFISWVAAIKGPCIILSSGRILPTLIESFTALLSELFQCQETKVFKKPLFNFPLMTCSTWNKKAGVRYSCWNNNDFGTCFLCLRMGTALGTLYRHRAMLNNRVTSFITVWKGLMRLTSQRNYGPSVRLEKFWKAIL